VHNHGGVAHCLWPADLPCPAPDLRLTGDHFVGKLSRANRPSIPHRVGKWAVIYVFTEVETFQGRL